MAQIRRQALLANQNLNLPSFLGGLMLGVIMMYLFVIPLQDNMHHHADSALMEKSSSSNNKPSRSLQDGTEEDGWHPINVFYGHRSALGADPKVASFAQVHQDEVVLELLGKSGYFIDLAANDALQWTNTLGLERHEGWNGLCIEPNPNYWYGLSHRRCTVIGALMGDSVQQVDVKFRGVFGGIVGKIDEKLANRKREPDSKVEKRFTAPITEVLERFHVPKTIDYMSLDVEGAEFLVMEHFPFSDYQIKLLSVERPNDKLKQLFEEHGYVFLKKLAWWGETLWAHSSTGLTPDHPKIAKIVMEDK